MAQVARVLADWGLRITALLAVRDNNHFQHDSAWYLVTAVYITPFIVLAPLHGSLSNGLPKRWVMVASALFCFVAFAAFAPAGPWLWCLGLVALGSALYIPTRYAVLPAAAQDARLPLNSVNGWMELGAAAAIVGGIMIGLQVSGNLVPHLPLIVVVLFVLNGACLLCAYPAEFPSDVRRPERPLAGLRG